MDASARSCAGLKAQAFPPVITSQKISSRRSPVRAAADSARGGEEVRGGARVDQRGHAAAHRPPAVARRLRAERESRSARFGARERVRRFGGLFRIDRLRGLCVDELRHGPVSMCAPSEAGSPSALPACATCVHVATAPAFGHASLLFRSRRSGCSRRALTRKGFIRAQTCCCDACRRSNNRLGFSVLI